MSSLIEHLRPGTSLELVPEQDNEYNPNALQITYRSTVLGWLPDYLVEEVRRFDEAKRRVTLTVERANGQDAPWHLRLLCQLTVAAASA